jgi:RNA recognition motif-containing protein
MLKSLGINPMRIRVLQDDQGKSKGAAFVDFSNSNDLEHALKMDGQPTAAGRRLRINHANSRPAGR